MTEKKSLLQTHAWEAESWGSDQTVLEMIRSHWMDQLGRAKKEKYEKKAQDDVKQGRNMQRNDPELDGKPRESVTNPREEAGSDEDGK